MARRGDRGYGDPRTRPHNAGPGHRCPTPGEAPVGCCGAREPGARGGCGGDAGRGGRGRLRPAPPGAAGMFTLLIAAPREEARSWGRTGRR